MIFGCDRVPFLLLLLICMALGLPGGIASGNYFNAILAVVLFVFGIKVLGSLAKYDPDALQVFKRAMQYKGAYLASSRVSQPDKKF
ncbi:MAG: VirB3 family type IV secretion system protein [Synergistaceae bacterium]|nr:VirB3 family type IV secretion system protein [Synergistaceae bacterium]